MDTGTLPMTRWLDPGQIARIRDDVSRIKSEAGWFAADVLRRLSHIAPDGPALFGETMATQRLGFVQALDGLVAHLDDAEAMRANLAGLAEPAQGWDGVAHQVDALTTALCTAFATWPGSTFDDESRSAWQALRVHGSLLLLGSARKRAVA